MFAFACSPVWRAHVLLACVCVLSGCWTSASTGDELRHAGQERGRRIAQLELDTSARSERVDALLLELQTKMEAATGLLTRNSADRGVQVEELREKLALIEGELAELRHSLETVSHELTTRQREFGQRLIQLARKAGLDLPVAPSEIPADKASHFRAARQAYTAGEFSKARALLREYLKRYANDDKCDDAQYWIGASYLSEGKPATSLGELRKVISEYSKGDVVDQALFAMADAFFRLHACTDAKSALNALVRRKPPKSLLRRAKDKLREVKRAPASYCTS